jgi:hypothetical protein
VYCEGADFGEHEMKVTMALTQRNIQQLEAEFWTVSDPKNSNYGMNSRKKVAILM